MIVPMSHLTVLCTGNDRTEALERLRSLGVLHITHESGQQQGGSLAAAEASLATARKALECVRELPAPPPGAKAAPCGAATPEDVIALRDKADALARDVAAIGKSIDLYAHFGDFNPADAASLAANGLPVTLFRAQFGAEPKAAEGAIVKILATDNSEKAVYGAIVGGAPAEAAAGVEIIPMPDKTVSEMRRDLENATSSLKAARGDFAACALLLEPLKKAVDERSSERDLRAAEATMGSDGGIVWITGFCPEDRLEEVRAAARDSGWGLAARAPRDDENPPTLLRPPRIFRPITSLFGMLDIAPGYREVDLSAVFYGFFTIFFAMLVGDFGYGALMLAATLWFRRKFPKAPAAPFILLGVFSAATCFWGILSCNYFGAHPAALDFKVSKWLNDPSYTNIMQLCFLLGAIHLTVARLWSAAMIFPDTKAYAEIGWAGVIWMMYCTSCAVVIPTFAFPKFMFAVAPLSILLIFLFMLHRDELKTEGINLAILPLNIISCLGDIISYVRLFAVGLASVKVAENFNSMALGMNLPLVVKIPVVVLILLAGHGLNLAMGALSILVHAVRLNTLEFSNHKGISWSGFAYSPFSRKS